MINIACSACRKNLTVKDVPAGTKVQCPGCGQVTVVPALTAARANNRGVLPPPAPNVLAPSQAPVDASDAPTLPPVAKPDATKAIDARDDGPAASLIDFLAPPQADDELGRLGKYRILQILGQGGMGVVYKAEDPKLKRAVAIKAMLPTLAASASSGKRFLREAEAMAAVEHDHIVRIYQIDEDRGVPYMAMEFLKGEPLDALLKRKEKFELTEVLRIGREIAEGLAAAHAVGLIHRDIKPGNIWLETKGAGEGARGEKAAVAGQNPSPSTLAPRPAPVARRVKILDFGLARAATQDPDVTRLGSIIGTPAYMAPEQGRGDPVDARCDLFSLGVVLYRLCTGQQPFGGHNTVSTLMSVATHEPPPPIQLNAELPKALSDLVMKLLEKDAAQRIASADEVIHTLGALESKCAQQHLAETLNYVPDAVPPPQRVAVRATMINPAPPQRRSMTRIAVAGAFAVLAMIAAGIVFYWPTANGVIRVEINDPGIQVKFDKNGPTVQIVNGKDIKVTPGEYGLHIERDDLAFDTDKFILKKGETISLKIEWLAEGKVQIWRGDKLIEEKSAPAKYVAAPLDDAWVKMVATLPADKQVEAVTAMLKERNPGFDGKMTPAIYGNVVATLHVSDEKVQDISPVRALIGLQLLSIEAAPISDLSPLNGMNLATLNCSRTKVVDLTPLKYLKKLTSLHCVNTQVSDLSPMKDLKLTNLNCSNTNVADLTPLKDMKLTSLHCGYTQVSDLTPLKNMQLTHLTCIRTNVADLTPLKGMHLTFLNCNTTKVPDLTPLKDMKLTSLSCGDTQVSDLTPLKDMKLTFLDCRDAKIADLTPLKDMKLETLLCSGTQVTDLSLLKGMPLKEIDCDFKLERDTAILRSIKTLEKINGKPAAQFWAEQTVVAAPLDDAWVKMVATLPAQKQVEAVTAKLKERNPGADVKVKHAITGGVVTQLIIGGQQLKDISPVRALIELKAFEVGGPLFSDLSPLKGMKLMRLNCIFTKVSDLTPLRDMKLTNLHCSQTQIADLTPLKDMKLEVLWCANTQVSDLTPLKDMKLTHLYCGYTQISDLTPLKNMKLTHLGCNGTKVDDLTPLKSMNLTFLDCCTTQVSDLSPLKDMKLDALYCYGTKVSDLTPLKDMKLTDLTCGLTRVSDLTPLKNMKLKLLGCHKTKVADLSPLKDMKLEGLWCNDSLVSDLSLLKGMPLKEIHCDFKPERDAAILRSIKTLEKINDKSAAQFWKEVEKK